MPLRLDVRRPAPGTGPEVELWLDVPSHLDYVGPAVELIVGSCPVGTLSPRRVLFNLRTALAEALSNAIAYGNHHDPAKLARGRVECAPEAVRVHVADDGEGFDPARVPDPTLPQNLEREEGRGLFLLRHLVDHVSFNEEGDA